jgi:protein-tyrosine phosphatase
MQRLLFLCSANYYRSRFAEHYFNWLAEKDGLAWRADSRGLKVGFWGDIGPISHFTVDRLHTHGIPINGDSRSPIQLSETDLVQSDLVIGVKEAEHRQMLNDLFPDWTDRIEYWHVDDLDCAEPDAALPKLETEVRALIERLADD